MSLPPPVDGWPKSCTASCADVLALAVGAVGWIGDAGISFAVLAQACDTLGLLLACVQAQGVGVLLAAWVAEAGRAIGVWLCLGQV